MDYKMDYKTDNKTDFKTDNNMENIGFLIKTILNVVDLGLPNRKLNTIAYDEKRAFVVMIMDECHKIYRLNNNIPNNIPNNNINSNINTKEVE